MAYAKISNPQQLKKMAEYRREASKLASKANKRITRLEKNKLKDSPAYQQYLKSGSAKFGVKGKTYNEVQAEVARLNRFLDSETSTVRGAVRTLKDMADTTKIKYTSVADLKAKSAKFFELSSKVEQYLRTVDDMASAVGYQKIWESINQYVSENKINLAEGENKMDEMIKQVTELVKEESTTPTGPNVDWYGIK